MLGSGLLTSAAWAQAPAPAARPAAATGKITGKIFEKPGQPAAYANIIVLGTKQGTQTDESGAFSIPGVPVGSVQISVQQVGFDKVVKEVQVNARTDQQR
mgnify:CR=1 FL=1